MTTTTDSPAQHFASALRAFERDRDLDRFVEVFADDVLLERPEADGEYRGVDGARRFWQQYLDQFRQVGSDFGRVVDGDPAVLEWISTGVLKSGSAVQYRGVSLLDFDAEGGVVRFVTYYDTAPFGP